MRSHFRGARVLAGALAAVLWPGVAFAQTSPAEASDESAFVWSTQPGCFERHLQRRAGNPLFARERRAVTVEEVEDARRRDAQELESLRLDVESLLSDLPELSDEENQKRIDPIQSGVVGLFQRATELGGEAFGLAWELRGLHRTLGDAAMRALPGGEEVVWERESRPLAAPSPEGSFLAQLERPDSPIQPDEIIPALLSEEVETIRWVVGALDAGTRTLYRATARQIVESIGAQGELLSDLEVKLGAVEGEPDAAAQSSSESMSRPTSERPASGIRK